MLFRPGVIARHRHWAALRGGLPTPTGIGAEPDDAPPVVHYQTPRLRAVCGQRGAGWQPKTRLVDLVTCPHCLAVLNQADAS